MRIPDLIAYKRDGLEHSSADLEQLILGFTRGEVPDYQISAWLMAVFLKGMTARETAHLTLAMAKSGDMLDLSSLKNTVDKHSTGGVGDKTSLVLTPMLAALGLTVAKMSGRGLAHTGGTIDKLESIPGWNPELSEGAFLEQARALGLALVGQSKNLAPADGLLYALRDVTATVESIPLIASSIMSKKLAAGAHTIVLDVKVGGGAFMKTLEQAKNLARAMVDIGRESGRNVRALLTDMETPLGHAAGNALEVREALATLRGEGPADLLELCLELAGEALLALGFTEEDARKKPLETIESGAALAKFRAFIEAQGGDPTYVDHPDKLEVGPHILELEAQTGSFLERIDALKVGQAVLVLGGGREQKGEAIDHRVGVEILKKPGEAVLRGERLARIHYYERGVEQARELIEGCFTFSSEAVQANPLVLERVS